MTNDGCVYHHVTRALPYIIPASNMMKSWTKHGLWCFRDDIKPYHKVRYVSLDVGSLIHSFLLSPPAPADPPTIWPLTKDEISQQTMHLYFWLSTLTLRDYARYGGFRWL